MKKLKDNYLVKLIMVVAVIFTMLFSTVAPIISYAAEDNETSDEETLSDKINFDVNWNTNKQKEINCFADTNTVAIFSLELKGVNSGFNNLRIKAEDNGSPRVNFDLKSQNTTNTIVESSKSNSSTLVFKSKVDSGVASGGAFFVTFPKATDFMSYNRTINFTLSGDYVDPITGETQYIQITKTLTATVSTKDEVSTFNVEADLIKNDNDNIVSKKTSTVGVNGPRGEWYATNLYAKIPGTISGQNVTYGKYEYKISRTAKLADMSQISAEENCKVNVSNLPSYMNHEINRNSDGSISVVITVGEEKEEYTADDVFDFSTNFVINVEWNVVEDVSRGSSETTGSSTISVSAVGNTKGYTITRSASGTSTEEKNSKTTDSYAKSEGICYYVGEYISSSKISASTILKDEWIKRIENGNTDFTWNTSLLYWDHRDEDQKEILKVYSYKDNTKTNLRYKADDGSYKSLNLENDELKLKKITVGGFDGRWEYADFYKRGEDTPFYRAEQGNLEYEVPEDEVITDYYVVFSKVYSTYYNSEPNWSAVYTLDVDKLSEKLSEDEIKNITGITRYQQSFMGSRDETSVDNATFYITTPSPVQRYSYFEMSSAGMNSAVKDYGVTSSGSISLSMYKNTKVMNTTTNLRNQNPKFYVALPKCFDYENIKVTVNNPKIAISNKECTDENEEAWYIDQETGYLVINCAGDWYDKDGNATVYISFNKTLNTYSVNANNTINAYMITDNESYICGTVANSKLTKNGVIPSKVGVASTTYKITLDDNVKIRNGIIVNDNEIYPSSTTDNQLGTYENAIKVKAGDKVEYKTELAANGSRLNNISFICKLPLNNNTSILGEKYSLESTNSLINLDKEIVLKQSSGNTESVINSSKYKVYYSTSDDCSFESEWTELTDGDSNVSNAKAIKIDLDESYTLGTSSILGVYFNMEMPDTAGIAGQISAVKFNKASQSEPITLEPSAVYVEKGIPEGTVNIQKVFQGYRVGSAPSGVTLENIEFQLKNVKTNEVLVINGKTDNEGKIKTDSTGKATLTGVPRGKYQVVELTEITGYEATDYITVEIKNGETKNVTVTNYPVTCELVLHKVWGFYNVETKKYESLNNQQGSVTLSVVRQGDNISYSRTVTTDPTTGEARLYVPYGQYQVKEVKGLDGWIMSSTNYTFDVKKDRVDWTIGNSIPTCSFIIEKTVPNAAGSTDTVRGIKFKIEGSAYAESYIDNNGDKQYLEYSKEITVGEDVEGVTQTISSDEKKVTINLGTVYAGNYTITEIDTPSIEIDGQNVKKYVDLTRSVSLNANSGNTVYLENTWRRAPVKIEKTAEEGVELDQFKFRIHGTSYYGTNVDVTLNTDKNGIAKGNILLGEYTIEEVGSDAFYATYKMKIDGQEVEKADSMDFKIKDSSAITIKANNVTGEGYVKVVKSLEGFDDPKKAAGIKFEVNGLAPSGENIHEVITIGEDGTGISNAIPAGGEYVLSEVADTVPDNFELAEDVEIKLTKKHTKENPLVINVENKRGKGNLEITTETNPTGGDVYPITYKVQEIEINEEDGSYTKIEGTERNIDGDLNGFAKLVELPAGSYIVSQVSVPAGWIKDIPQIVDVPMYNTAYANFVIEKEEEIQETEVRVSKTIINPEGTIATDTDFEKYELVANQSFEAKITNLTTKKEYFVFMDSENEGSLVGIPEGKYSIEEIYKPKYIAKAYNLVENDIKNEIQAEEGKYCFEIGSKQEGKNVVNINIVNQIDSNFGFGGQDSKDNLSKTDVETVVPEIITRTSLVVVDEEGNFIDGCTFDIFDSNNNKVAQISPRTKRNVIKGMDAGQYTIKNVTVPEGYLLADDISFTVYNDAVRVVRFEIQKNIPRGNLTLQTVYTDENGKTKNVAKSQYKIVNSETGELLTFIRKADGSYARSNLPTATDTVSLRAGKITLRGVETGNYEVGLTGITENYGLADSSDVEVVDVIENETQDITVQTVKRTIIDIQSDYESTYVLDSNGSLWGWGYNDSTSYPIGTGNYNAVNEPRLLIQNGVKKISIGYNCRAAIMDDGSLYVWGGNYNGLLCNGTSADKTINDALANCVNSYIGDAKVVDVSVGNRSILILDENGKLWYCGDCYYSGLGNAKDGELYRQNGNDSYIRTPICLTDMKDSPFANISVKKVYSGYNNMCAIIDNDGRLWTFSGGNVGDVGFNPISNSNECYEVTCLSTRSGNDIYEAYRNGAKIVDVDQCFAIDENGNVYGYGTSYGLPSVATCYTKAGGPLEGKKIIKATAISGTNGSSNVPKFGFIDEDNNLYFTFSNIDDTEAFSKYKDVEFTNFDINYYAVVAVDKKNDLYGYSSNQYVSYGLAGADSGVKSYNGSTYTTFNEFQVSLPNYAAYFKYDMKFQKVMSNNYGAIALDEDGNLWSWGHGDSYSNYNSIGNASGMVTKPRMIEFNEDIKFRDIAALPSYYHMYAVDTEGRVWVWGYSYNALNGFDGSTNYLARTCISELPGNPLAEAYANGVKIEEIDMPYYNYVVAKDNQNKLWVWGSGSGQIGNDNVVVPKCISDIEPLKSLYDEGKYIKKYASLSSGLALLDNEGMLYYLYNNELNSLEVIEDSELLREMKENGVSIVDIDNEYNTLIILDSEGRLWTRSSWGSSETCLSTREGNKIAEQYAEGNKIVYINCAPNTGSSDFMAIDSKGHIWKGAGTNGNYATCVADDIEYKYAVSSQDSNYAIDKDGHMWVWGSNYSGRLGIGIAGSVDIQDPTITTAGIKNSIIYGKKFVEVTSNGVEDTNGEVYRINSSSIYLVDQTIRYLTNKGIEIKQELDGYVLDTEGKLYAKSNNKWTYPTDVEGSDLYNAYYNDGVKIEEILKLKSGSTTVHYFKDSNNNLWNTNFKKVTEFEFGEFVTTTGSNTIIKDTEGNYYINGSNTYGILGNGDLSVTSSEEFIKITLDEDSKINEIIFFDGIIIYVKDQDSRVWAWGSNRWGDTGMPKSTEKVATPYCWGESFDKVYIQAFSYSDPCYNATALDMDGHVWTCGYGGSGTWPESMLGKSSEAIGMVNNSTQMGKIVKLTVSTDCVYAINEDGELWVWGNNAYGGCGYATSIWYRYYDSGNSSIHYYTFRNISNPVCATKAQGVLKDKKIKEVIDICGYYGYTSEINKKRYLTGNARVLVVTEDGEVYKMGYNKVVNSYCRDMYTDGNTPYPTPELMDIDGNIIDVKYYGSKEVLLKTDTGAIYRSTGTSVNGYNYNQRNSESFYKLTDEKYTDMTLDEAYSELHKGGTTYECVLDTENHVIKYITTYYDGRTNELTFDYPESIDAVSAYTTNGSTITIVDSDGELWIKGSDTGLGNSSNTFICVTKKEYLSEPIWNTIRNRWSLIYRKY